MDSAGKTSPGESGDLYLFRPPEDDSGVLIADIINQSREGGDTSHRTEEIAVIDLTQDDSDTNH